MLPEVSRCQSHLCFFWPQFIGEKSDSFRVRVNLPDQASVDHQLEVSPYRISAIPIEVEVQVEVVDELTAKTCQCSTNRGDVGCKVWFTSGDDSGVILLLPSFLCRTVAAVSAGSARFCLFSRSGLHRLPRLGQSTAMSDPPVRVPRGPVQTVLLIGMSLHRAQ